MVSGSLWRATREFKDFYFWRCRAISVSPSPLPTPPTSLHSRSHIKNVPLLKFVAFSWSYRQGTLIKRWWYWVQLWKSELPESWPTAQTQTHCVINANTRSHQRPLKNPVFLPQSFVSFASHTAEGEVKHSCISGHNIQEHFTFLKTKNTNIFACLASV